MDHIIYMPSNLVNFILVTLFSLIFGLLQKRLSMEYETKFVFGTDRTFTFIGILGFILYISDEKFKYFYLGGGFALIVFLSIYYYNKLQMGKHGMTTIIVALITYSLAPLIITQPKSLTVLIIVIVLVLIEMKDSFLLISQRFNKDEFITLGKFLIIAGVILPILSDEKIIEDISLTPYKIWFAVVIISSISYLIYLVKKFIYPNSGIVISGILGGLYSSTATTLVLARKSKNSSEEYNYQYSSSIVFATAMMYIRIYVLMLFFNYRLAYNMKLEFFILILLSAFIGLILYLKSKKINTKEQLIYIEEKNPLEFRVALLFTLLYVIFSFATYYILKYYGTYGLSILSYIIGVTDIDPFLISLFQNKFSVETTIISIATLSAMVGNNIMKTLYAVIFGNNSIRKTIILSMSVIILINFLVIILF